MSDFWTRKKLQGAMSPEQGTAISQQVDAPEGFDQVVEETWNEYQEENLNALDEDEEADNEVLSNASLRLEQGRLYQMIMSHDLFGETDADVTAIKNVQREIRKFARERMEIMLGMRQESVREQVVVSSPFNDLEVVTLKVIAEQMSKGATRAGKTTPAPAPAPKKEGITAITGTTKLKMQEHKPLPKNRTTQTVPKQDKKPEAPQVAGPTPVSPTQPLESFLSKPIEKMTPDELLAYDKQREERMKNMKAALPPGYSGVPSSSELESLYITRQAAMKSIPGSNAAALVRLIGTN